MNKQESSGFTLLLDWIVEDVGLVGAAVYGVIWRYCQMRQRVCYASKRTLAKRIGITRQALIKHLHILIEKGYVRDLTPARNGTPHEYTIVIHRLCVTDEKAESAEPPTNDEPVNEVYTTCKRGLHKDTTRIPDPPTPSEHKNVHSPAGIPAAKSSSTKKKRTLSATQLDHNEKRATLLTHFEQKTGHDLSVLVMGKAAKARLWWNPVRALLVMCDWDLPRAKRLINATLQRLDGLTIADPNSLIKTAQAILAEGKCSRASAKRPPPRELYYPNDPDYMEQARV